MSTITLKVHVDGKQICLDGPYPPEPDVKQVVTMVSGPDQTFEEERQTWFALGRQPSDRAHGANEPDCSDCTGKPPPSE